MILCWQLVVVAIASSAVIVVIKMVSDRCPVHFIDNKWVNTFMPIIPTGFAMLFALAIKPDQVTTIPQSLVWGLIPGLASAVGWKLIKSIFMKEIGVGDVDELIEKKHEINDKQDKLDAKQDKVDVEQKEVDKQIEKKLVKEDKK